MISQNTRYIQITSAHRNRKRYPHPAQFTIELALSGGRNSAESARDAIYDSYPIYPPANLESDTIFPNTGYMYSPLINGVNNTNSNVLAILPVVTLNNSSILQPLQLARPDIQQALDLEYAYIGDTLELVSVGTTTYNEFRTIKNYTIENSTILTSTVDTAAPIFTDSIPLLSTFDCDIDNFFVGWTITFTNTNDTALSGITRQVAYYRGFDRRIYFDQPILTGTIASNDAVALSIPTYTVTLDSPFSVGTLNPLTTACSTSDRIEYRIHSGPEIPTNTGTLVNGTTTTFTLPASAGTIDYKGYNLWITSSPVVVSGALASATFTQVGGTQVSGTFTLSTNPSLSDTLANMTLTLTSGVYAGQSYRITDWDNSTLTGTVVPGWTSVVVGDTNPLTGDTFTITSVRPSNSFRYIQSYDVATRVGHVSPPFSYVNDQGVVIMHSVTSNDTYQLLRFQQDNYQPLNYPESQLQMQCYDISLISLTLPNTPVLSGNGGRITQYPYVYVEFKSVTQGTSAYTLYTNNPSIGMGTLFMAPMIYNWESDKNAFVTLDGHHMNQTLKFQPNDAFQFSVYLPDGSLLVTTPDYMSPSSTNPRLQVSACFKITKTSM